MRAPSSIVLVLLLLVPGLAAAETLELGLRVTTEYNDNVFGDADDSNFDQVDDAIFNFGPEVRVRDREGDFQWDLSYRPSYLLYVDTDGINAWQHEVNATGSWQVGERTVLSLTERFSRLVSRGRFNEAVDSGDGDIGTEVDFGRNDLTRNTLSLQVEHRLSAAQTLVGNFSHALSDFEVARDNSGFSLGGSYNFIVSPRSRLGIGPRFSVQETEGVGDADDASTTFYGVTGSWNYVFEPGFSISLAAGPTWIDSDQSGIDDTAIPDFFSVPTIIFPGPVFNLVDAATCPTLEDGTPFVGAGCGPLAPPLTPTQVDELGMDPSLTVSLPVVGAPNASDTRMTFFANASLRKEWRDWSGLVTYRRTDAPSSGIGAASITDTVTAQLNWRPSVRWRMNLGLTWSRRTQATESLRFVDAITPTTLVLDGAPFPGAVQVTARQATTIDSDARVDQYVARFGLNYRLRERLTLLANAFYSNQKQSGDEFFIARDLSRFSASIGFRWDLDPIPF